MIRKYRYLILFFVTLALIYAGLTVLLPPNDTALERYKLSPFQLRVISLTVVLPYILIWFTALYGYIKFKNYADQIPGSREHPAWDKICRGLLVLAIWMPVTAVVSTVSTYVGRTYKELLPTTVIIHNYLTLILILTAFYILHQGSKELALTARAKKGGLFLLRFLPALMIIVAVVYTYLSLANPARYQPTQSVDVATYYLPDVLIVLTIIFPYLVIWHMGFQAVKNILTYSSSVAGVFYRNALKYLAGGVVSIVFSLIILRLITSLTAWFNSLTLKYILAVVYLLLVIIGLGYVLIALGAKKLKKLEDA